MYPNKGISQDSKETVQMLSLEKGLAWRRRGSRPLEAPPPPLSRLLGSPSGLCFALGISVFSLNRAIFSNRLIQVATHRHHPPTKPQIHRHTLTHSSRVYGSSGKRLAEPEIASLNLAAYS